MITLVTGGARSGKSRFAENLYKDEKDVVYIATSKATDAEMRERVKLHQESRPSEWRTYEGNYDLQNSIGKERNYLLDCITVLTSNIMFDISKDVEYIDYDMQRRIEDTVIREMQNLINGISLKDYNLVLVTNEVGDSIVPEHHISRVFRDIQGRINQKIASLADEVYLVCCGIPVKIK
ncbi:bifunctional adenosylcobinamide kinase/adenosylcobinamide-phosphate guanylyltransferase [Tissierella carlieri]|uniref:Bifunctional adenosylcobinamide kinase/adenosylcobinamide-phosphate guanylyltransferase n=1 Tax=Tissierella carlieri TaxID=689904 RepID=A0ABT1S8M1_9FIRM|nr:bifunctional adenosylcobinamide kinase/adenosylcobinamide-phosphate guanylyltransferase [Tissierella carlieri]MBU5312418.1 bifunctional adenosylcobinamide kinase/adenosylcobinamide-phosphate guanylyltransferase [Tissierella carlieri]MCQ4922825.1 bifunctional adenosylcobinamide kinase/adenosylcobinamide-phosphate guanylyltransferase [Tissierella carlieri]MDU5081034.1 bifunctional adenosylcobinamide kinase/adenosylcobinamide-phosphate guanylyltransferase [Bacillota bacterium]